MQDGTTADMVFDVPALIAYVSAYITLDPGDLLITGTPSGVGVFRDPPVFLEPGDTVRCEVEGIGRVEDRVMDGAARPPDACALVKTAAGPASSWRPCPTRSRDQRRGRARAQDRHLRHRPPHRVVGSVGGEDDPAARRWTRVRWRDRRGRQQRLRLSPGRPRVRAKVTSCAVCAGTAWPGGATCAPTSIGLGVGRDGAFAEYVVLPMTNIWHHWPGVDEEVAAIFDPFGNAVHTALSFPVLGEDVLVSGPGRSA